MAHSGESYRFSFVMRKNIFLLFCFCFFQAIAQKETQTWIGGFFNNENPEDPNSEYFAFAMKHNDNGTKSFKRFKYAKTFIFGGNASICDKNGDMMIFFNGEEIYNRNMEPMKGSDSLNFVPRGAFSFQSRHMQNGLILPYPRRINQFMIIYQRKAYFKYKKDGETYEVTGSVKTFYCVVDMDLEKGLGKVIEREKLISSDTLCNGRLQALRHANGRDWWIVTQKYGSNIYYKMLLDPKGIRVENKQDIGLDDVVALGQNAFSPDGKHYIDFDNIGYAVETCLFDFDRCSGKLSKPRYINFPVNKTCGGVAFSPNSRYLYINRYDTLYQFDMKAPDLLKSKQIVGVFDNVFFKNIFSTGMFNMKLAYDGKIYIACQGEVPFMHIIHNPDMPGLLCKFELRGLKLPALHEWNVPNYPNFALGALKGSPCDTLKSVTTQDIDNQEIVQIFPNPASDILNISVANNSPATLIIRDISGRVIESITFTAQTTISTANYFNGMIFCEIWQDNQRISTERIVIQH